ncbi:hypothetical protein GBA52_011257 [Prunus armeniaca]|nr:hypothetical protein GBA52_011257 [Prunus armeniaca]
MDWTRGHTIGHGSSATVSLATSCFSGDLVRRQVSGDVPVRVLAKGAENSLCFEQSTYSKLHGA